MHRHQGIQPLGWMWVEQIKKNTLLYNVVKGWLSTSTCRTGNQPF
jgi:hypothetical protein